jgi:glycosyltransferase involved in cell wall biosynthesis
MRILFLHNNFPDQYRRIAGYLRERPDIEMVAATLATNKQPSPIRRVDYAPHREPTKGIHPTLVTAERAMITAGAAFKSLLRLKQQGWVPDLVCSHSGWGPSLFVKELWPDTRLLSLFEWYYRARGSDADFLSDEPIDPDAAVRIEAKNIPILMDYAAMDWGVSPTEWQRRQFPAHMRPAITTLHEGVDTGYFAPEPGASFTHGAHTFRLGDEVITYVARGMEPYRGFPQFMQAVAKLQKRRPKLHVFIAGNDRVAYGAKRKDGKTYKEHALETLDLDLGRVHFLGLVSLEKLRAMYRVTAAHVYLTVPFVLSWSMLEAMAAGALVVGSRTPPVEEIIADGENGLLVDFFDTEALAARVEDVLEGRVEAERLRRAARETIVARYDTATILERQVALMRAVAETGRAPADWAA